jgi:RES domain-containing protein
MYYTGKLLDELETIPLIEIEGSFCRRIAYKWRDDPLSGMGSYHHGGRYNAPHQFQMLYTACDELTAMLEVGALFELDGVIYPGPPRNPEITLALTIKLHRVLNLLSPNICQRLGTSYEELVSDTPSRFVWNEHYHDTPTQDLGFACYLNQGISGLMVPSAAHRDGFCLNILSDRMFVGEIGSNF